MEVLVVGLGFSGALASLLLADKGYDVISADPNPVIPHCTGIVSKRFVELMGIEDLVLARPQKLLLKLGNIEIEVEAKGKAAVIDRERLDAELRDASAAAGARRLKRRIRRISPDGRTDLGEFRRIIDAEGAKRALARVYFGALETLPGVQVDVSADRPEEYVLIDLTIDGLFGRIVPLGDGKARVGLATRRDHLRKLSLLLRRLKVKRELGRRGGLVVVSGPRGGLAKGRLMLIGDAAGVPKPLTGGGLMYGLINVIEAVKHVEAPGEYERSFMRLMAKEYRVQRILRRLKDAARVLRPLFVPPLLLAAKLSSRLDMDFRSGTDISLSQDILRIRTYLAGSSRA